MPDFKALFAEIAPLAFDKQLRFADALENAGDWQLNLPEARLSFANGTQFAVELLGTEALPEAAWLWAWADVSAEVLPPALLQQALAIRAYGEEHAIPELTEPMHNIDERLNGHHFAMLGASLARADAYYRAPFEGGALFLLIPDAHLPALTQNPIERIVQVFPQVIQNIKLDDHKRAFVNYLNAYGLHVKTTDSAVFGLHEADETRVHAEFDERQRLTKLTTVMK